MILVFLHLLAASMALGAIVATDLRLLSKLAQDRIRIAPPNDFVARIVMVALLMLYVTGGAIVFLASQDRPDYLANPKLQSKLILVVLLTINAFVLHRVTFPRLGRGRRVARWHASDWIVVAVPVAISNFLWMFCAFLGIARAWNNVMPMRDILEIAAGLYVVAQLGVFGILAIAGSGAEPDQKRIVSTLLKSALASVGHLGKRPLPNDESRRESRAEGRREARRQLRRKSLRTSETLAEADGFVATTASGSLNPRPALRLVEKDASPVLRSQRSR